MTLNPHTSKNEACDNVIQSAKSKEPARTQALRKANPLAGLDVPYGMCYGKTRPE